MSQRLNFKKTAKLHLACATDDIRPVMEHIYFENGYAYATDAHILVKAKISDISTFPAEDIEQMNGKMLHGSIYRNILTYDFAKVVQEGIKVRFRESEIVFQWSKCDLKYPNADKVITATENKEVSDDFQAIGIKPNLISRLVSATGINNPVAIIKDATTAILIKEPNSDIDITGLIMPYLLISE